MSVWQLVFNKHRVNEWMLYNSQCIVNKRKKIWLRGLVLELIQHYENCRQIAKKDL